ncbi:MAG: GNAT family N-acetyltransferase [Actinomycetes bacterium]
MTSPSPAASFVVRPEAAADREAVASLHASAVDEAGTDAGGGAGTVAALVDALRPLVRPDCGTSLVAVSAEGAVVGHVLVTPSLLDAPDRLVTVGVLSPLGVAPAWQRQGVGRALVAAAVEVLDQQAVPLLFLEGVPDYYPRLGFRRAAELGFRKPSLRIPDEAFQVLPLRSYDPALTGTLVYDAVFWQQDAVGLR